METVISVAMCTFNGARFLGAQLASIANQDRPPDELVICDDGSSDGSIGILTEFARDCDFPVRLVTNDENLGSTKNFEKAVSLCAGDIVVLADQDDVWYRQKLRRIEKTFVRSKETVLAFSDADVIDKDSRLLDARLWSTFRFDRGEQKDFASGHALSVLLRHPVVTGASMAFRKAYLELLAPIPAKQIHDRWISLLLAASGKCEAISDRLMQYRQHEAQQIGPGPRSLRERTERARLRSAKFYLDEMDLFCEIRDRIEQNAAAFPCSGRILLEIQKKISHLEHRGRLPRTRVARIPRVLRRAASGDYWRYSTGWSSIAKDLFL